MFAIGPCTLAQGQTLVAQAGGNTALALMLLVVTNILAVFISPFLVQAILATRYAAGHVSLQPGRLLINLVVTILTPSLVGKVRHLLHPPTLTLCLGLACIVHFLSPPVAWHLR